MTIDHQYDCLSSPIWDIWYPRINQYLQSFLRGWQSLGQLWMGSSVLQSPTINWISCKPAILLVYRRSAMIFGHRKSGKSWTTNPQPKRRENCFFCLESAGFNLHQKTELWYSPAMHLRTWSPHFLLHFLAVAVLNPRNGKAWFVVA